MLDLNDCELRILDDLDSCFISCKPFEVEMAKQFCTEYFSSKTNTDHLVVRGKDFHYES